MTDLMAPLGALGVVVVAAWGAGALTAGGAVAAAAVGAAVLAGTGWPGGLVLVVFFVTSSGVSRLVRPTGPLVGDAKGDRRDAWQVMANGGVAALGAVAGLLWPGMGMWVVTSSLAAAAADTWATAIGTASRHPPRLLISGRRVAAGTNGGVTVAGTLGGLAGAAVVAGTSAAAAGEPGLLAGIPLGILGMLADALLGERWQGRFQCPACLESSERRVHRCGTQTVATGGVSWLTNDGVNALTTLAAGTAGLLVWRWWG